MIIIIIMIRRDDGAIEESIKKKSIIGESIKLCCKNDGRNMTALAEKM
jgi:hypothetical protein